VDKRAIELRLVEDGGVYYLISGTLVRVIPDDHRNGLSEDSDGRTSETSMDHY
jgi:hypothetical protein